MDIEKALIDELAKNGTEKARDLFLKWQESRIEAKEMLLGKLEQINKTSSLHRANLPFCNEIRKICAQLNDGQIDVSDGTDQLFSLLKDKASDLFDEGFMISTEKYNSEHRGYDPFDDEENARYKNSKKIAIYRNLS